jgi:hypothetical protein
MSNCYLCGYSPASNKLNLKGSFTAHSLAVYPESNFLCDRCEWSINLRAKYQKPDGKISTLYARNWSWLFKGENLIYPILIEQKNDLPIVSEMPSRALIREWLVNPPKPPFTIAIAESGQKHILFLAQEAQNRELFPVQFELDTIYIKRKEFILVLNAFESLMGLEATKTEILAGDYKSSFLLKNLDIFEDYDIVIQKYRGSRFLDLVSYVAIKSVTEITPFPTEVIEIKTEIKSINPTQLSLF